MSPDLMSPDRILPLPDHFTFRNEKHRTTLDVCLSLTSSTKQFRGVAVTGRVGTTDKVD